MHTIKNNVIMLKINQQPHPITRSTAPLLHSLKDDGNSKPGSSLNSDANFATFLKPPGQPSSEYRPNSIESLSAIAQAPINPSSDETIDLSKAPIQVMGIDGVRKNNFSVQCNINGKETTIQCSLVSFRLDKAVSSKEPGLYYGYFAYINNLGVNQEDKTTTIQEVLKALDSYINRTTEHPRFKEIPKFVIANQSDYDTAFYNLHKPTPIIARNNYEKFCFTIANAWDNLFRFYKAGQDLKILLDNYYGPETLNNVHLQEQRMTVFECLASVYSPNYGHKAEFDDIDKRSGRHLTAMTKQLHTSIKELFRFAERNLFTEENQMLLEILKQGSGEFHLTAEQSDMYDFFTRFLINLIKIYQFLPCFSQHSNYHDGPSYKEFFHDDGITPKELSPKARKEIHGDELQLLLKNEADDESSVTYLLLKDNFRLHLRQVQEEDGILSLGQNEVELKDLGTKTGLNFKSTSE